MCVYSDHLAEIMCGVCTDVVCTCYEQATLVSIHFSVVSLLHTGYFVLLYNEYCSLNQISLWSMIKGMCAVWQVMYIGYCVFMYLQ